MTTLNRFNCSEHWDKSGNYFIHILRKLIKNKKAHILSFPSKTITPDATNLNLVNATNKVVYIGTVIFIPRHIMNRNRYALQYAIQP